MVGAAIASAVREGGTITRTPATIQDIRRMVDIHRITGPQTTISHPITVADRQIMVDDLQTITSRQIMVEDLRTTTIHPTTGTDRRTITSRQIMVVSRPVTVEGANHLEAEVVVEENHLVAEAVVEAVGRPAEAVVGAADLPAVAENTRS
jgi:hypothetical protein